VPSAQGKEKAKTAVKILSVQNGRRAAMFALVQFKAKAMSLCVLNFYEG